MRILIVDDEPAARGRLRRLLDELEVECVGEAANGLEALELTRTRGHEHLCECLADGGDRARWHAPRLRGRKSLQGQAAAHVCHVEAQVRLVRALRQIDPIQCSQHVPADGRR